MLVQFLLPYFAVLQSVILFNEVSVEMVVLAEESRYEAIITADVEKLSDLLADEFTYNQPTGIVFSKAGYIESITEGNLTILSADFVEMNVEIYDGFATSNGVVELEVRINNNETTAKLRFLNVWIFRDGRLQLASRQSAFLQE